MIEDWYVRVESKIRGPVTLTQLRRAIASGKITPDSDVRAGKTGDWMSASCILEPAPAKQVEPGPATQPVLNGSGAHPGPKQEAAGPATKPLEAPAYEFQPSYDEHFESVALNRLRKPWVGHAARQRGVVALLTALGFALALYLGISIGQRGPFPRPGGANRVATNEPSALAGRSEAGIPSNTGSAETEDQARENPPSPSIPAMTEPALPPRPVAATPPQASEESEDQAKTSAQEKTEKRTDSLIINEDPTPVDLATKSRPFALPGPSLPAEKLKSEDKEKLLREIYGKRKEMLAQRDELQKTIDRLKAEASRLKTKMFPYEREATQIQANIADIEDEMVAVNANIQDTYGRQRQQLQARFKALQTNRQNLNGRLNTVIANEAPIAAKFNGVMADAESNQRDWNALRANSDQLRVEWLLLIDPLAIWLAGEQQQAIRDMTQWIILDPEYAPAYVCRGLLETRLKSFEKASVDFSKAIKIEKECCEAWAAKAMLQHEQGDRTGSIKSFEQARRHGKKSAFVAVCQGMVFRKEGKFPAALRHFENAAQFEKQNPNGHAHLAFLLATCPQDDVRTKHPKKAVAEAQKCCELTAWNQWWYLDVLAAAYADGNEFAMAVEYIQKAKEAGPPEAQKILDERLALYNNKKPLRGIEVNL
jgi:tetratricopeptide (TPR) repeat protein